MARVPAAGACKVKLPVVGLGYNCTVPAASLRSLPAPLGAVIVTALIADSVWQLLLTVYVTVTAPADTPVSKPVAAPIVALDVLLVLQVPPLTPSVYNTGEAIDAASDTVAGPVTVPA